MTQHSAYSDVKRNWEQEYERAEEEVAPQREKRGIKPLVQQTRVLAKALYRTLAHYSDLSYAELVRLFKRAKRSAQETTVAAEQESYSRFGLFGAFLMHLLQAPLILASNPLAILVRQQLT